MSAAVRDGARRTGSLPTGSLPTGAVAISGLVVETRERDPRPLVDGVDLAVAPGEALGIVGASGSGKSLTLRAVLGLLPGGTRVSAGSAEAGGRAGMVFQDPQTALDPLTRVGTHLVEALRARDAEQRIRAGRGALRARALALLDRVHLPDPERSFRAYPHELSGGQRQRVVIALALAGDPDALLCDEPTTALDVTVQRRVLAELDELRRERGLTLLFVSHDLAVVAALCERIAVMDRGRVVETGTIEQLQRDPRHPATRALLAAAPRLPRLEPLAGPGSPSDGDAP